MLTYADVCCPSLTARVVTQLLERHFKEFVDTAFTARMEAQVLMYADVCCAYADVC